MQRPWFFLVNPFLTVTKNSYRTMKQLGDFTVSALAAFITVDPAKSTAGKSDFFNDLLTELSPAVDDFNDAYDQWVSQQGIQKGQTQTLTEVLDELSSTKIEDWDIAIQNVYKQRTAQYTSLLPHRRSNFQKGSQEDRISAVGALSLAIGSDLALQGLKTDVDNFHDKLVAAHASQKGSKTKRGDNSSDVESKRILLAIELYSVLGSLLSYYKQTPENIGNFFYMPALHTHAQVTFRHDVNGSETLLALTRTFNAGDQLKLINRGNTPLQTALVPEKNDGMPATAITIAANDEEIVNPTALGPSGNRFLIVKNMSETEKGAYTIELL